MVTLTNIHGLPRTIVNALKRDPYSRGNADASITEIIGSPRIRMMRQKWRSEITEDVSERIWSLFGSALHHVVERGADSSHIVEERLFVEVLRMKISGAIDLQEIVGTTEDGMPIVDIYDYKTTGVWSVMNPKEDWDRQLNCYAYLIEKAKGWKVNSLNIVAVIRDWSKAKARTTANYPVAPMQVVPIKLWSFDEREAYVQERISIHQDADRASQWGESLPLCSDEDRWFKPGKLAVMKQGRAKAVKLFEAGQMDEATAYAGLISGTVEARPGQNTRCQEYCPVAEWCDQFQSMKGEQEDE